MNHVPTGDGWEHRAIDFKRERFPALAAQGLPKWVISQRLGVPASTLENWKLIFRRRGVRVVFTKDQDATL